MFFLKHLKKNFLVKLHIISTVFRTKKWSKAAVAGFRRLVDLVAAAKEMGLTRADLKASTAFIPRVADALAFALEKNILVEVGIGKGDSPGSETFFCLRGSFPLSTLRFSTL